MTALPSAQEVAAYLKVEGSAALNAALKAETAAQAARCRTTTYTDDLREALCRRVARNLAMRGVPLGVQIAEFGGTQLGSNDPEVRRLEAPYRRLVMG